jgi:hypothetical protein
MTQQPKPDALEILRGAHDKDTLQERWFEIGRAISALEAERRENAERMADIQRNAEQAERALFRDGVLRMRGYEYQEVEYGGSGLYEQCAPGQGRYIDRREVLALLDGGAT